MTNSNLNKLDLVSMYSVKTDTTFEEWCARFPWLMWEGRKNGQQAHAVDPVSLLTTGVIRTFTGSTIPSHAELVGDQKVQRDEFGVRCMRSLFDKLMVTATREAEKVGQAATREAEKAEKEAEKAKKREERAAKAKAKAEAKEAAKVAKEAAKEAAKATDTSEMEELKIGTTKSGELTVKSGRSNVMKCDLGEVAAAAKGVGVAFNPEKAKAFTDGTTIRILQSGVVVYSQEI